jgi:predicted O-methyltransferase YrrM
LGLTLESYRLLQEQLGLTTPLPVTPDWSAAADFLFIIKEYCLSIKPSTIVECSSGLTTLTLARCCQLNQHGHVFSLENGKEYVTQTEKQLQLFGVDGYANVIHAPLEAISIDDTDFDWYNINKLPDLSIDMLVIDGPPGFIQKHSRFPALPVLFDRLANNSIIFMDDAARKDEKEIAEMWKNAGIEHEYIETERGCSIFKVIKK